MQERRSRGTAALAVIAMLSAALAGTPATAAPDHAARFELFTQLSAHLRHVPVPDALVDSSCPAVVSQDGGAATSCAIHTDAADDPSGAGVGARPPLTVEADGLVRTPSGIMAVAGLPGVLPGAYVRVYGNGDVAANAADGRTLWTLPGVEFSVRAGIAAPRMVPTIPLGADPLDPFTRAGEDAFAVGDLSGDGAADVAVAHTVYGQTATVTVIDGRTGDVVWHRLYPGYVTNLAIQGTTLLIGNETGDHDGRMGEDGTRSSLHAWRFSRTPAGTVDSAHAWSRDASGWARWLALEPLGSDRVAAAWTDTPVGSSDDVLGHVVVVDSATGTALWEIATDAYPRVLRHDASRGEVVVLEQTDPLGDDGFAYTLVGRTIAAGTPTASITRGDAIALGMQVGVLTGEGPDWIVGDLEAHSAGTACVPVDPVQIEICAGLHPITAGRVAAMDPSTGQLRWEQSRTLEKATSPLRGVDTPQPYGVVIQQRKGRPVVAVASFMPSPQDTELQLLDGETGDVVWSRRERNLLLPLFLAPYQLDGSPMVLAASSRQNVYGSRVQFVATAVSVAPIHPDKPYQVVSAYTVEDGEALLRNPVLADVYAAAPLDVDGAGPTDLVVGGESGAVFALDGAEVSDNPGILWTASVSGQVHHIEVADLDGDGIQEVVVAASFGVDVLDGRTGEHRYAIPRPEDFVWTVAVGDVNGDGGTDVVVPARDLSAYRGDDGEQLWRFAAAPEESSYFGSSAITDDGLVASQYHVQPMDAIPGEEAALLPGRPGSQHAVLVDGDTGEALWDEAQHDAATNLYRGVIVGEVPGVLGTAAAFTWDELALDGSWYPRTDVYDVASGDLAYSGTAAESRTNMGTALIPGLGAQHYNFGASTHVRPVGPVHNLDGALATDLDVVRTRYGPLLAVPHWPSRISIVDQDALQGGPYHPHRVAEWAPDLIVGATTVADLDADGTDELLAYQFDWGAWATSRLPLRRGADFSQDAVAHGFAVLRVSEAGR